MSQAMARPVSIEVSAGLAAAQRVMAAPRDRPVLLLHGAELLAAWPSRAHEAPGIDVVALAARMPLALVARTDMETPDGASLRQYLSAAGRRATLGHAGRATASHLCAMRMSDQWPGVFATVSYRASAAALSDMAEGHIDLVCERVIHLPWHDAPAALTVVRGWPAGTGPEGGLPDAQVLAWLAVSVPERLSSALKEDLASAVQRVVQALPWDGDPPSRELARRWAAQVMHWRSRVDPVR